MRFGVFYELQLPRPWTAASEEQLLAEALEQVEIADEVGIDVAWAVEHHFLEEYSHCSAPEVFLSACAARTKRIRLGHGIRQAPPAYNHPARTAECVATLDLISGGRVEFGIGEGATRLELGGFGIGAKQKRAMSLEAGEQIANMMAMSPYPGYEGEFFSMPCRDVIPKPAQKPHPPMWIACTNRATIELAARRGLGALAFAFVDPSEARHWADVYYDIIRSGRVRAPGAQRQRQHRGGHRLLAARGPGQRPSEGASTGSTSSPTPCANWWCTTPRRAIRISGTATRPSGARRNRTRWPPLWAPATTTPTPSAPLPTRCAGSRRPRTPRIDHVIFLQQGGKNRHEDICGSLRLFGSDVLGEFSAGREEREAAKADELAPYIEKALARKERMRPPRAPRGAGGGGFRRAGRGSHQHRQLTSQTGVCSARSRLDPWPAFSAASGGFEPIQCLPRRPGAGSNLMSCEKAAL